MLPNEKLEDYILKGIIQIALPSCEDALDHAFVILDEAYNTFSNENVPNPHG
jgi:phosphate starvation-inducible PhoH-like protein